MKRRCWSSFGLVIAVLLLTTTFLAACKKKENTPEDYLGRVNYDAPTALLQYRVDEEGEWLDYREVKDLDKLLNSTGLPVVLCIRQHRDYAAPIVIPQMEEWAVQYHDKAYFIFTYVNESSYILDQLEVHVTPTFYLLQNGSKIMYASWEEENALVLLQDALDKRVKEE